MKVFIHPEWAGTVAHARLAKTALYLHDFLDPVDPGCFSEQLKNGLPVGDLVSLSHSYLRRLAEDLGVKRITVRERTGLGFVRLCGKPLEKALAIAGEDLERYRKSPSPRKTTTVQKSKVQPVSENPHSYPPSDLRDRLGKPDSVTCYGGNHVKVILPRDREFTPEKEESMFAILSPKYDLVGYSKRTYYWRKKA